MVRKTIHLRCTHRWFFRQSVKGCMRMTQSNLRLAPLSIGLRGLTTQFLFGSQQAEETLAAWPNQRSPSSCLSRLADQNRFLNTVYPATSSTHSFRFLDFSTEVNVAFSSLIVFIFTFPNSFSHHRAPRIVGVFSFALFSIFAAVTTRCDRRDRHVETCVPNFCNWSNSARLKANIWPPWGNRLNIVW